MHPSLLQLLTDDHRHRLAALHDGDGRRSRRTGAARRVTTHARTRAGALLVMVGTRLAGPRTGPVGLHRPPT